jgi:hypothetical protein
MREIAASVPSARISSSVASTRSRKLVASWRALASKAKPLASENIAL